MFARMHTCIYTVNAENTVCDYAILDRTRVTATTPLAYMQHTE